MEQQIRAYMKSCLSDALDDATGELNATFLGEWAIIEFGIIDADEQERVYDIAVELVMEDMARV